MSRIFVTTSHASGTSPDVPFIVGVYEIDSDGDALLDVWEQVGIDINKDGLIDLALPALGANLRRKDVFVEVDFMATRDPNPDALGDVIQAFAHAPVVNPDGSQGINLHVDVDEEIPFASELIIWAGFDHQVKAQRFGTPAQRADANGTNIRAAKRLVYHYGLYINNKCGKVNNQMNPTTCLQAADSSGQSNGGPDFVISLGHFAGTRAEESGTFMHELGHNLGRVHKYYHFLIQFHGSTHQEEYPWIASII
jgi:hypothetical protein